MGTTKLEVYNAALTICGERTLASLTENREPRRLLDQVWDNDGVRACLERGQWNFAMRAARLDYDPSVTPDFGYQRAFNKPTDWVLTSAVCTDEYFNVPLTQYVDETGFWYADYDEIFVKYVSDDANYGGDLSIWPATFTDYASAHFAEKIILKITSDENKRDMVFKWADRQLKRAKSNDAMASPTAFPAPGSWVKSRAGSGSRRDRGSRGNLIG